MDREELIQDISKAIVDGGDQDFLEYAPLIADRLLFKNPTEKQKNEVLGNLRAGLGVQSALVLIECF